MENENKTQGTPEEVRTPEEVSDQTRQYLQALEKQKENSVPRSQYDATVAELNTLREYVLEGKELPNESSESEVILTDEQLAKRASDLLNKDHSDIGFVEDLLELRDEMIRAGYPDPADRSPIPGMGITVDPAEAQQVHDKVCTVLKESAEYAEGDNSAFMNELGRRTEKTIYDAAIANKKRK